MPEQLKDAMRRLSDKATKVLEAAMDGDDVRAAILAANTVLDRGYGGGSADRRGSALRALLLLGAGGLSAYRRATATPTAPTAAPLAHDGEKPPASRIN